MSIKRVIFVPDAIIHKYEEVRSDKKLIKEYLVPKVGEVGEIQATINMWSDNPLDRKLYQKNMIDNGKLSDKEQCDEYMEKLVSKTTIKNSRLKMWNKKGPKPYRNLLGLILLSRNSEKDLEHIPTVHIEKINFMNNRIIQLLESNRKNIFVLYEVDAKIYKKNVVLLKNKKLIMEKVISDRSK